ncbi:hypothetical protein E4U32_002624 [Claviceps aff. humidiphila group G2b]|nr:hypothetical protein E4U32_002624 [Claviceps aff. humidiphila group G2b]
MFGIRSADIEAAPLGNPSDQSEDYQEIGAITPSCSGWRRLRLQILQILGRPTAQDHRKKQGEMRQEKKPIQGHQN